MIKQTKKKKKKNDHTNLIKLSGRCFLFDKSIQTNEESFVLNFQILDLKS